MLTDKDIRDIKELAERSGMDYFVNVNNRSRRLPSRNWQVLGNEGSQYNKNYKAILYQRIPFEGRTLYAQVARWYSYPSFANFEITLMIAELAKKRFNLYDIYRGLHPDFKLKNLRTIEGLSWTGYRPPLIIIDDLIPE